MDQSAQDMQTYYSARASYYDAVYLKPERQADIQFLSAYLPAQFAGRNVLEIACGTGYWTQHIAPVTRCMLATDGNADPLSFARQRPGTAHISFQVADAFALENISSEFDAAFAGLWFSHVLKQDQQRFLNGLHSRLQPGARVIMIDNNASQLQDFPITETDADGNTFQHRDLRDGSVHRILKNFPTEAELYALVASCATDISYQNLGHFWLFSYTLK